MDILSNREIAAIFWIAVIASFMCFSEKMKEIRYSFKDVLSVFFVWKIQSIYLLMFCYIFLEVYVLSEIGIWDIDQLKNTVIWTFSFAVMAVFQINAIKEDRAFFKHAILDNLKLIAFLEFIIGVYSFSILAEIVLLPTITFIVLMSEVASREENHKSVKILMDGILGAFGVFLIGYTVYMLFTDVGAFAQEQTFYDLGLPPLMTLLYLPFIFCLLVYVSYESVFVRTHFSISHKGHRCFAKALAMVIFNVRIDLLERWSKSLHLQTIASYSDVWKSFQKIFKMRKAESNPKEVNINEGWSPYLIKDSLIGLGFKTGYYKELYDDGEWFASSPYIEFGADILPNNVAYYIDGNEHAVKILKLIANINSVDESVQPLQKLSEAGSSLYQEALGEDMPKELEAAILNGESIEIDHEFAVISVVKEMFPDTSRNGYSVKFQIEHRSNIT